MCCTASHCFSRYRRWAYGAASVERAEQSPRWSCYDTAHPDTGPSPHPNKMQEMGCHLTHRSRCPADACAAWSMSYEALPALPAHSGWAPRQEGFCVTATTEQLPPCSRLLELPPAPDFPLCRCSPSRTVPSRVKRAVGVTSGALHGAGYLSALDGDRKNDSTWARVGLFPQCR